MRRQELCHHGVKGQKWGVRRGPPYPIEDTVMRKGTRLNSVSSSPNSEAYRKRGRWTYTFNPNDEHDSTIYKGPFAYYLTSRSKSFIYEHQYETIKDLKMPTRKERVDEFINMYKNHRLSTFLDLKSMQSYMRWYGIGSEKARKLHLWKADAHKDQAELYEIFNHAMENVTEFRSTRRYKEIMETKFDAMVDDNNQGVYNGAHDPVIIFRAEEALRTIGQARALTPKEVAENYRSIEADMAKKGKRVLL